MAKSVEMAKLHRAKGQLEANSTLRGKRRWEKYEDGDLEKAQRWEQDAASARTSFRKALELSAAAATFAAWARFEEALGDVDAARGVLEDGLSSCPRAANIWREFVQFEGRHRGEEAAEAARRRARAALGG